MKRESIEGLLEHAVATFGRVDMLINGAGVNSASTYLDAQDEDWDRVLTSNLTAVHRACQVFGRAMADAGGGSIVNIASVSAHLPLSRVFADSASKAAVVNLTQNVAREFAPVPRPGQRPLPRVLSGGAEPQDPRPRPSRDDHEEHPDEPVRRAARARRRDALDALPQGGKLHHRGDLFRGRRVHGDAALI